MDYEKAYKEALERAKNKLYYPNHPCFVDVTEIFPELKESEDESIRKEIISIVKSYRDSCITEGNHRFDNCIAWLEKQGTPAKLSEEEQNRFAKGVLTSCALSFMAYLDAHRYEGKMCVSNGEYEEIENAFQNAMWDKLHRYYCKFTEKQGEQNLVDKIEPKFREGDWISGYYTNYKVLSVNNNGYVVEDVDGSKINILFENEKFHHLFTIEDAKNGDVLTCNIGTFIYYKTCPDNIEAYIYYNPKNGSIMVENFFKVTIATDPHNCFVHPASKEQRDALFQKMKEEGYEWDADKNELKKIGDWVDLGLPSGTLWKNTNETNPDSDLNLYTYDEAMQKFGDQLPTKKQLEELKDNCRWTWTGNGYNVTGPNGNSIFMPAAGNISCDISSVVTRGSYWSSKTRSSQCAWYLYFTSLEIGMGSYYRWRGQSVRLVNKL